MKTYDNITIIIFSVQKLSVTLVDGTVLLQGPLHARVVPSECSWSLLDYPAHKVYKTQALQYVQISLEKGHNYKEVWATVLDREYLSKVDDTRPAHSEEYVRYQEYLQEEEERRRGSDFQRGQSSEEEIIDVSYVDVEVNRLKGD